MASDEHDHHRRGGLGCFPVLLGFFIGVAATLTALILLGLWANEDSAAYPDEVSEPPSATRPLELPPETLDERSPPPSPLLQPDGVPIGEDAPAMAAPEPTPEPEAPAVEPQPAPPTPSV